jgi:D-glycero-D-manno-heptose 1,7-bisphosphate phosphatase
MPWIILDRDGVINEDSDAYIKSPGEWRPIPGSLEAIAALARSGFSIAVLSNQSGVARGLFDLEMLEAINARMFAAVEAAGGRIDALYFCPHGPEDGCACRKPEAGLFERFAREQHVDLTDVPAIGDSYRDLQAARAAGASPILLKTGKGRRTLEKHPDPGCPVFENLHEAAQYLLSSQSR